MTRAAARIAAFVLVWAVATLGSAVGAGLEDGRTGNIQFESSTPSDEFSLINGRHGAKATVEGTLSLPKRAKPPYSAVVIAHGSGGVRPDREPRWAEELNKAGIAAFVVDSYGPRNITGMDTGDINVSAMANVADAYAALRLLSTHPQIDAGRVAIIGFSRGGQVALWSAFDPLRKALMGDSTLAFSAHVLVYPACNFQRVSTHISQAPMLHLHGEADDLTPLAACREYLDRLRAHGARIHTITYPDAYHDFDFARPARYAPRVRSAAPCHAEINLDDQKYRLLPAGPPFASRKEFADYERRCTSRGATIGGNAKARARAYVDSVEFLQRAFGAQAGRRGAR
jgi:dienelactone hydrolase